MDLIFVTPVQELLPGAFGAASYGMTGCWDPVVPDTQRFARDVRGTALTGSYADILAQLPASAPQAAIVLFGNAGGENAFLRELHRRLPCPMAGGAAAIDPVTGRSHLIPGGGEAAVLLLEDERYQFEAVTENLHTTLLERCTLTFSDPRVIDTINGCDALAWYREQRAALGFGETDFEHVTLTDPLGVNAHLSCEGGKLVSGRDLYPQMTLRLAKPDTVLPRMQAFYDDPDALIFGCAGLKGILPAELHSPGLGLFLFGEVCTVNGQAEFGNLMLSKLRITKR